MKFIKPKSIIAPSLLSCDLANISHDAQKMIDYGCDWLHMDIMDGHFVPNISFGPPVIASLRKAHPKVFLDCHLMVTEPMKWVKPLQNAGASLFTFHIESVMPMTSTDSINNLIKTIKSCHMKVGIAIKPNTSIDILIPYVQYVDLLLVMTVEPGFSGQKFMENMMIKVRKLRKLFPTINIEVDGGLSTETVDIATEAGANVIVSASAIFGSKNPLNVIQTLRDSLDKNNI